MICTLNCHAAGTVKDTFAAYDMNFASHIYERKNKIINYTMKSILKYLKESNNYDEPIKTTGKHKIKVKDYNTDECSIYEVNVIYVADEKKLGKGNCAIIISDVNDNNKFLKFQDFLFNEDFTWVILTSSAENEDPKETWKEYFGIECPEWLTKDKIMSENELTKAVKEIKESKNLKEYIKEALLFGKKLSDELSKEVDKMKLRQNWNGDCFAVISDKSVDLDAFATNVSSNLLPNSKSYKDATGKTKYFAMYNSETKCSTVWVGLEESITKMYNNLKKDRTIQLTELF